MILSVSVSNSDHEQHITPEIMTDTRSESQIQWETPMISPLTASEHSFPVRDSAINKPSERRKAYILQNKMKCI